MSKHETVREMKGPPGARGAMPIKDLDLKAAKRSILRLMSYITGKHRIMFILVIIMIVVSAFAGVAGSLFMQTLIDDYITPLAGSPSAALFAALLKALAGLAVIYVAGILSSLFYMRMMALIAHGVLKRIRDDMFSHMQDLPIGYFDTHTHGDIMSRYTNDTDTLRQLMCMSFPQMINSVVSVITVFCSMLYLSIPLTLLVLCGIGVMMLTTGKITGASSKFFMAQQKSLGAVNGYIEEMIHGQKVVKVFCHEEEAKAGFDRLNEELCEHGTKANVFANILMPLMANLGNLIYVITAIAGGYLALATGLSLGSVAAFLQLTRSFTMPISQISMQASSIIMALAGSARIFELMDEMVEEDDGKVTLIPTYYDEDHVIHEQTDGSHAKSWAWKCPQSEKNRLFQEEDGTWKWELHLPDGSVEIRPARGPVYGEGDDAVCLVELTGHVVLKDVTFGYNEDKIVLHDINLFAEPGQKVAFVGATGAGKTTITNLINRFYDIQEGTITYDGIDITGICKKDLRRSLGVVLQDVNLFTGTVRENIRYGKLNATDAEVEEAAKLANAYDFIVRLPDGFDTMLDSDGGSLSQGQRQLISIARAAVADPPVMILDEATSSIDTRTESIVQAGMDSLMKGRTVFVIAHRLSTVQNSDAIMVLEQGRIIERGSHDALIAQKGKYYQFYTGAFELE